MQCNERTTRNNRLGSCTPFPQDVCMKTWPQSWRGMADAHLKIQKHFSLDACMYLSSQILSLCYLFSGERIWRDMARPFFLNFNSKFEIEKVASHILSTHVSPCPTTLAFVPFPLASICVRCEAIVGFQVLRTETVKTYETRDKTTSLSNLSPASRPENSAVDPAKLPNGSFFVEPSCALALSNNYCTSWVSWSGHDREYL